MGVTTSPVDDAKLNDFLGQMVGDLGAAANAPLMVIGDKLGLYKALAAAGPLSSAELAAADRDRRTLRPGVAGGAGGLWLRQL